jgi:hypothetical protein
MKLPDYDGSTSRAFYDVFCAGLEADWKDFHKLNPRLRGAVKRKGLQQAIIDIMAKTKIQDGLPWAFENGVQHRCLEKLVKKHPKDFPEDVQEKAKLRYQLLEAQYQSRKQ